MSSHGITCRTATVTADVVCESVPGQILHVESSASRALDLWFNFGIKNQLISLVALSREAAAPQISAALAEVTSVIRRKAGPPVRTTGGGDAHTLGAGLLRQASSEFAFADYYACARATNMGKDFMLTEEYRSLAN